MKQVHALFKRLGGSRRPPTGPLTTAESVDAEEARAKTLSEDGRRSERDEATTDPE